ncbi:MAG TPA: hypothetical protein ENN40_09720 [Candidatus Aminicenantes bacterium]|nr:hypothetical protein [Candidatus Aminicenantes bacterium]
MNAYMAGATIERSGFGYAFFTFTCFGVTNFLLGVIAEQATAADQVVLVAPVVLWLGTGLLGLAFLLSPRGKSLWRKAVSNPGHFWMAAAAGVCLALGMLTLKLGFLADPASKGPITAVTAANAVVVALLVRFLLRERLLWPQWGGILVTVAGISVMALSAGGGNALRGLGYGVITLTCFGITNTVLKLLGHRGMPSMSAAITIWLAVGACGAFGIVVATVTGPNIFQLKPIYLLPAALVAGLSLGAGMWSLKRGVTVGRAGPVTAIAGANAWLVTVLDLLAFRHFPSPLKLTGMVIALIGVAFLALSMPRRGFRG